jgi:hypothetical protein
MQAKCEVQARRAYRLALVSFVVAVAALLVATVALLDSDWGGKLLRAAASDAPDNRVMVWGADGRPQIRRDLYRSE